jgi:nitroreductase
MFEEKKFKQALGVPNDVTIYALIPVGWPAGNFGPVRRRPVSEVLHWDRW